MGDRRLLGPGRWLLLAAGMLCAACLPALAAGDEPAPAAAVPEWRQAAREAAGDRVFLRLYVNDIDTLWNEFSRSQLYGALARDPAVAAGVTKLVAEMDKHKKSIGKQLGQADDLWLPSQIGKLGPFACGVSIDTANSMPQVKLAIRHRCDAAFVKLVLNSLANPGEFRFERLRTGDLTVPEKPYAYRLCGGETILSPGYSGVNIFSNGRRFMVTSFGVNEQSVVAGAERAGTAQADEDAFAAFLGKSKRWLSAVEYDLPKMIASLPDEADLTANDLRAIAGAASPLYMKETLNKGNRFDLEAQYSGVDLNKGLLFLGAGDPLNNDVAQVFPEEMIAGLHANWDFKKFLALDAATLAGVRPAIRREIREAQRNLGELVQPPAKEGEKAVSGPKLTRGVSLLIMEPDRLEEIFTSLVVVIGIEPGFKITPEWVKALPTARGWDQAGRPVKIVSYSGADIAVVGEDRWVDCLAVVGGVLVTGTNLKQVKRVVRYLTQVQAGTTDPRKSNEWQHITALQQQDGWGSLYGFVTMRMEWLLKTAAPTGLGAGAMLLPELPTDVKWADIAGRLQPATGALMYDSQRGLKYRMESDLPLGSLFTMLGMTEMTAVSMQSWYYQRYRGEEEGDLPSAYTTHEMRVDPAVEGEPEVPVAPAEAVAPDPAPADPAPPAPAPAPEPVPAP